MSLDRHILAILEPSIKLDDIRFDAAGETEQGKSNQKPSTEPGSYAPFIRINNLNILPEDITNFNLNISGFIPTIDLTFIDSRHAFSADSIPRDGDVISVRIAAREQKTFKDIRADFLITNVFNFEKDPMVDPNTRRTFSINGILKVPGLKVEECKSYKSDGSDEHLKKLATTLKIGYATNIDKTDDKMTRVCSYMSRLDFIKDTIDHSYIDEKSFQIGFIDTYYYLNFIDLNKIFNSKNEFEDTLMHMFSLNPEVESAKGDAELNSIQGKMILTNHSNFGGSSQHIQTNTIINNSGGISFQMGTKRTLQFFENDSTENLVSFDIEPIASDKMRDNEEPLKGRRADKDAEEEIRQKYVGRIDVDKDHGNMNLHYYTSSIVNRINRTEIYKMSLEVTLGTPNLGIYRGQKIPVLIFTKNMQETEFMKGVKERLKDGGFKTMGDEVFDESKVLSKDAPFEDKEILDEFKSGFYIVDDIEYIYDVNAKNMFSQKIKLLRREWPTRVNQSDVAGKKQNI